MLKVLKSRVHEKEEREKQSKEVKYKERAKTMKKVEENQTRKQKELRKKVFQTLGRMGISKPGEAKNFKRR